MLKSYGYARTLGRLRPSAMENSDFSGIKLVLLAGKWGMGKTTCSAAMAFHFAGGARSSDWAETEGIAVEKDFPGAERRFSRRRLKNMVSE